MISSHEKLNWETTTLVKDTDCDGEGYCHDGDAPMLESDNNGKSEVAHNGVSVGKREQHLHRDPSPRSPRAGEAMFDEGRCNIPTRYLFMFLAIFLSLRLVCP